MNHGETRISDLMLAPFRYFGDPGSRMYFGYLLSALGIAVFVYMIGREDRGSKSISGMIRYIFPLKIWLHPSAIQDYWFLLINAVLKAVLIVPLVLTVGYSVFSSVRSFLYKFSEFPDPVIGSIMTRDSSALFYTLALLVVGDFARFLLHYISHRWSFLWDLHKVHHSAEVLTPATVYRVHPLESLLFGIREGIVFGLVTGICAWYFGSMLQLIDVLGINAFLFVFRMAGSNLRHSHIRICFGPWLEHIFISPCQHQYHHGGKPNQFNRNYGSIFAVWDWAFGSLKVTSRQESIHYGLPRKELGHYSTVWKCLWNPLKSIARRVRCFTIDRKNSNGR